MVLKSMRDALVMAFSTGSSTVTMPVTFRCLRERVGLREQSASMGALIGANFNNDGTALYEATAALFISQMLGRQLDLGQQLVVVLTSVVASVGAAGIPRAGLEQ
jgi:Na+/H+-dicarboxylate symporter